MMAEKKVDTNVYGGAGSQNGDAQRPLKENEQNVKNRTREARFNAHIHRYGSQSYINTHCLSVLQVQAGIGGVERALGLV